MRAFSSRPPAEQTLLRSGFRGHSLRWVPERYASALRWSGAPGALRHWPTPEEQPALVSELIPAALELSDRGELLLFERTGRYPKHVDTLFAPTEAHGLLADPTHWFTPYEPDHQPESQLMLTVPEAVRQMVRAQAYVQEAGIPAWSRLSGDQQLVLQCAFEASSWLTGIYGCLDELSPELQGAAREALIDEQFELLSPFVRDGWIEIVHTTGTHTEDYTVIPLDDLRAALANPELRYEGDEWGVGLTCWFTSAGDSAWLPHVRFD